MTRDTCRLPNCDREPRGEGADLHAARFCSPQCEVKYDHLKADAAEARYSER